MKKILSSIILVGISIFFVFSTRAFKGESDDNQNNLVSTDSKLLVEYSSEKFDSIDETTMIKSIDAPKVLSGHKVFEKAQDHYNYPNKEWWYTETKTISSFWKFKNIYGLFSTLGSPDRGWNMDNFINSKLGEGVLDLMLHWLKYPNEMCQEVLNFWEENGIKKEMHNAGDPENKWASYMPISAYEPENKGRRYPLLLCFRGGNDPIYSAEVFGFVKYSVEAQYITVIPYNRTPDAIQKVLDEIMNSYPVDASRIYITGNGRGGWNAIGNAFAYPEKFAAIAPFGIRPIIHVRNTTYTSEEVANQVESLKAIKMPLMVVDGQYDGGKHFPLCMPRDTISAQNKLDEYNTWLKINNIIADSLKLGVSEGLVLNSDEWIERQTGIDFPVTWVEERDGTDYYYGDFFDENNINLMRITIVKGCNHWHGPSYAEIIWNYLKQFSRDPETGKVIYHKKDIFPTKATLKLPTSNTVL